MTADQTRLAVWAKPCAETMLSDVGKVSAQSGAKERTMIEVFGNLFVGSQDPCLQGPLSSASFRVCWARRAEKSSRIPHRRARGTADPQSRGRGKRSLYSRRNYRCGASGRSSEHQFVESARALQSRFFEIPDHRAAVPGKIHGLVPLDGLQRGRAGIHRPPANPACCR